MGRIHIRDGFEERTFTSSRWDGTVTIDLVGADEPQVVVTPDAPFRDVDVSVAESPPATPTPDLDFQGLWLLVAPLAAALTLAVVAATVGPAVLDTGRAGSAGLVAYGLLVPFFLVCLLGTLLLYEDSRRVRSANLGWRPNPWAYLLGGAVGLVGLWAGPSLVGQSMGDSFAQLLVGAFVVALVMSSLLAGPVYLLQRSRHLGVP